MPIQTIESPQASRIVILGTGTAIGKTYVSCVLAKALNGKLPFVSVLALKPLESGIAKPTTSRKKNPKATQTSDAASLAASSSPCFEPPIPPFWLPEPLSPHLSARRSGQAIVLDHVVDWVSAIERSAPQYNTCINTHVVVTSSNNSACKAVRHISTKNRLKSLERSSVRLASSSSIHYLTSSTPNNICSISIIETAGAVFSPLNSSQTNFDLALSLEPCQWVLVAPDRLGVLHDVTATLATMKLRGRIPDFIVLSQPNPDDASLGTNAGELEQLGIASVDAVIPYCGEPPNEFLTKIARGISQVQT